MNRFQKDLLLQALHNYDTKGSTYTEYPLRNGDAMMYYTDAAEYLVEDGYIVPLSENIGATTITLTDPGALYVCYELTDRGIQAARQMDMEK